MNDQRKPGAEADRIVDLLGRRDAVLDQPERFAPKRFEQSVGDEAVDLFSDMQRPHADRAIELASPSCLAASLVFSPPQTSTSGSR